jgi:hypothetical protein
VFIPGGKFALKRKPVANLRPTFLFAGHGEQLLFREHEQRVCQQTNAQGKPRPAVVSS